MSYPSNLQFLNSQFNIYLPPLNYVNPQSSISNPLIQLANVGIHQVQPSRVSLPSKNSAFSSYSSAPSDPSVVASLSHVSSSSSSPLIPQEPEKISTCGADICIKALKEKIVELQKKQNKNKYKITNEDELDDLMRQKKKLDEDLEMIKMLLITNEQKSLILYSNANLYNISLISELFTLYTAYVHGHEFCKEIQQKRTEVLNKIAEHHKQQNDLYNKNMERREEIKDEIERLSSDILFVKKNSGKLFHESDSAMDISSSSSVVSSSSMAMIAAASVTKKRSVASDAENSQAKRKKAPLES